MSTNILVATSSVKFFTGITTTSNDDLIETLVPIVQSDIRHYCNNYFVNSTMYHHTDRISLSTATTFLTCSDTSIDLTDYLQAGNIAYLDGTIFNDGYYSISTVASSYIVFNETISSESSSTGKFMKLFRVEYPKDLPLIAARMIKHIVTTQDASNVASESLGDYSINYVNVGSNSYPRNIVEGLNKYRKARFK